MQSPRFFRQPDPSGNPVIRLLDTELWPVLDEDEDVVRETHERVEERAAGWEGEVIEFTPFLDAQDARRRRRRRKTA